EIVKSGSDPDKTEPGKFGVRPRFQRPVELLSFGIVIFGFHASHSFFAFSCRKNVVPLRARGEFSGLANSMPPASSARSDSNSISMPLSRPPLTLMPLEFQNAEPVRTSPA